MGMKKVGEDYEFLVVGPRCWGVGTTEVSARQKAKDAGGSKSLMTFLVYLVPTGSYVDDMGYICTKKCDVEIILLREVKDGKDVEPKPKPKLNSNEDEKA